jgi:predicted nucleotidyltransferase
MERSVKIDIKTDEVIDMLKSIDFIQSILLFGSRSRGKIGRDIDICIIPSRELNLKERLSIDSAVPSSVDISIYFDLPVHIRKRIAEEGKVLFTKDMYNLLTLFKENDLEYAGYRRHREYYNKAVSERMRKKFSTRRN